jgi:hypothetical protein
VGDPLVSAHVDTALCSLCNEAAAASKQLAPAYARCQMTASTQQTQHSLVCLCCWRSSPKGHLWQLLQQQARVHLLQQQAGPGAAII